MSEEPPLYIPQVRQEHELTIVGFHDGDKYLEFGVDSVFMPLDDINMWTHEFSERAIYRLTGGCQVPISISMFPTQILFRVHHMMVSLHTPSIIRIADEKGNTITRRFLLPEEFENLIQWKNGKTERE